MGFSGLAIVFVFTSLSGCIEKSERKRSGEIRFLIDSAPASLNPRTSFDAIGQRLEMLAFRGLTRLDTDLDAVSDLSEKWRSEAGGKRVVFTLREGENDHAGSAITSARVLRCLRNYLIGEAKSLHASSFPGLREITLVGNELRFDLDAPDPYLPRNISILRYFTVVGAPDDPCRSPRPGEILITNGLYSVSDYPEHFDRELRFIPRAPASPPLVFEYVREETSRLFKLLNNEADGVYSSFSPTKTEWISEGGHRGFRLIERSGTSVNYLAFNLRDPILRLKKVRLAITRAIDRDLIVKNKLRGQAYSASSFLSPELPEGIPVRPASYDPTLSERLLDEAGYPRGPDGIRFHIRQKVATNREGLELAQVFRDMLGKVGVAVDLDPVEPAVFFASIRKGNFQMYVSRWIGVADGSIFYRTLRSGVKDNRVGYSDPRMDGWLDQAVHELDPTRRKKLLAQVQAQMLEDLPYFPLWHWTNGLILRDSIIPPSSSELSLSGSYFPLGALRFKVGP